MIMRSRETAGQRLEFTLILKLGGFGVAHDAQDWRGKPPRRNSLASVLSADRGLSGVFGEYRTITSVQIGGGEADFHQQKKYCTVRYLLPPSRLSHFVACR